MRSAKPHVLHVSLDGLLGPVGFSQIARVSLALARWGFSVTIVSLERAADLACNDRVHEVRTKLARGDVGWVHARFTTGGSPAAYALNISKLAHLASIGQRPTLTWIRGFPAAPIAMMLPALRKAPFIYDIRGYWAHNRAATDNWPRTARYAARKLESAYYRRCAAAVSLTALGADDIRAGKFAPWPSRKPVVVIPTCVDYAEFTLAAREPIAEIGDKLDEKLVVGFVGSVNADYHVVQSLRIFGHLAKLRDDARLLCVSGQHQELLELASREGIPTNKIVALSLPHERMAAALRYMTWGLLLLRNSEVKRASMPTKLAEFFATGVRPVHYGCNAEVADWVARTGSGFTLVGLDDGALRAAAERIASAKSSDADLVRARDVAAPHFSLEVGAQRYAQLMRDLLA